MLVNAAVVVAVNVDVTGDQKGTSPIEQCRLALLCRLTIEMIVAICDGVVVQVKSISRSMIVIVVVVIVGICLVVAVNVISGKLETRAA